MRSGKRLLRWMALLWLAASVQAQQPAGGDTAREERAAVAKAAQEAMLSGPQVVQLLDQAAFALPENYGFIPKAQATTLMEMWGNSVGDEFLGMVVPLHGGDSHWFAAVDYINSGYIKDDDAKEWNADDLLANLQEGTEAGNERRAKLGIPPLKVTRWVEVPKYDADVHHLVWSAEIRLKEGEDNDPGVNYNTYVLGREGYISLNLVTSLGDVEADKQAAKALLTAIRFNDGKRYGEFNASTDKVAAYGLAALVGGLALKKLGLLAVIGAFVAKFFKVMLVAVAAAGGWFSRFFKRKPAPATTASPSTSATTPPVLPAPRDPDKDPL